MGRGQTGATDGHTRQRQNHVAINSRDVDFQGHIFSMQFIVDRERLGPIGYMDEDEPEGDVWELWDVIDGKPCPLCGKLSRHTFCPDCGKYVFPDDL